MSIFGTWARRFSALLALMLAMAGVLAMTGTAAAAPGGNSAAAHECQQGGFENYTRADGTVFKNAGECSSYATRGGELVEVGSGPDLAVILPETPGGTHTFVATGFTPNSQLTVELVWSPSGATENQLFQTDANGEFSSLWSPCVHGANESVLTTATDSEGLTTTEVLTISCP